MNLDSLKDAVAGISLYDVKAAVRKAQNGGHVHLDGRAGLIHCSGHELYGNGGKGGQGSGSLITPY